MRVGKVQQDVAIGSQAFADGDEAVAIGVFLRSRDT
ncbi:MULTISPECIES: hypothetical protein [Rhodopirellula]|nr:hypothetical protein CGZ80_10025 [Rhodopirellula sp. MGV]PNY36569.1 hypothetical protein C2E31_11985 [Rhodopirellula baltica]